MTSTSTSYLKGFITITAGLCVLLQADLASAQQPGPLAAQNNRTLSPRAIESLVTGIAFYPDELVETILQAAQHPLAIRQASEKTTGRFGGRFAQRVQQFNQSTDPSVASLKQYPEILAQLNDNLAT
ncbi:MAG: DUF3300 domain-containing protein, partial [Gimesia chilikensis]